MIFPVRVGQLYTFSTPRDFDRNLSTSFLLPFFKKGMNITQFFNNWTASFSKAFAEEFEVNAKAVATYLKSREFGEAKKPATKTAAKTAAKPVGKKEAAKPAAKSAKPAAKKASPPAQEVEDEPDEPDEAEDEPDETEDVPEFEPFGKVKTRKQLDDRVAAAKKVDKYYNVSTGLTHAFNEGMSKKYSFYYSWIAGVKGSEELAAALQYCPGEEFKGKGPAPVKVAGFKGSKAAPTVNVDKPAKDDEVEEDEADVEEDEAGEEADAEDCVFVPFGKFTSLEKLQKGVANAVAAGKYCNASTGLMHADTPGTRKKYLLYNSNVSGIAESEELKQILKHYPGELVNEGVAEFQGSPSAKGAKSSPKAKKGGEELPKSDASSSSTNTTPSSGVKPKIIIGKHSVSKVTYIPSLMAAWDMDDKSVYGIVEKESGKVLPLTDGLKDILTKMGIRWADVSGVPSKTSPKRVEIVEDEAPPPKKRAKTEEDVVIDDEGVEEVKAVKAEEAKSAKAKSEKEKSETKVGSEGTEDGESQELPDERGLEEDNDGEDIIKNVKDKLEEAFEEALNEVGGDGEGEKEKPKVAQPKTQAKETQAKKEAPKVTQAKPSPKPAGRVLKKKDAIEEMD